jgi:hypothetical protein
MIRFLLVRANTALSIKRFIFGKMRNLSSHVTFLKLLYWARWPRQSVLLDHSILGVGVMMSLLFQCLIMFITLMQRGNSDGENTIIIAKGYSLADYAIPMCVYFYDCWRCFLKTSFIFSLASLLALHANVIYNGLSVLFYYDCFKNKELFA